MRKTTRSITGHEFKEAQIVVSAGGYWHNWVNFTKEKTIKDS